MDRADFLRGAAALLVGGRVAAASASRLVDPRLRSLQQAVRGQVIGAGSSVYDAARVVYNERYDGVRPLAIVRPVDAKDVQAVVLWARRTGVRLIPRSGGHSYGGYSTGTGVVVDLRRLAGISINSAAGSATLGAGARLIDVYAALAAEGRSIPAGSCPTVGLGGLALGGGVGLSSRKHGTTSDNVHSLRIVTADGRLLTCAADRNADLYWACRGGGGGNFGIVTDLELRTFPAATASYYFLEWPWAQAHDAVDAWQRFAPTAPDELFSLCQLRTGGTGPVVSSFGQFLGAEAALRKLLGPLTRGAAGGRLTTGSSAYLQLVLRWAGCLGRSLSECHLQGETPDGKLTRALFGAKSDYVARRLPAAGLRTLMRFVERRQAQRSGSGSILLDSYGGAINRVPPDATAFVHRDQIFSAQYLAYWRSPAAAAPSLGWLRDFRAAMQPYASGYAYQNYIDPELPGWQHAYYGANYPRLVEVKRTYDPDGFLRFRQGIGA